MSDNSHIEWTDATWNPVTGCSVVSPGCTNCYAMKLAGTRLRNHASRAGLTTKSKSGPVWNGTVRFNEAWLLQPLRWRKPRTIFVCAHGDLFHEDVPDEWIDRVFAVMGSAPQHTYQVLTKRAERMRQYLSCRRAETPLQPIIGSGLLGYNPFNREVLPPRNIWLGVSIERQQEADERIPHLLTTPAAVRFISAEPLLGPIDLTAYTEIGPLSFLKRHNIQNNTLTNCIDWVIVGGESGAGARAMHPGWARSLREQCAAADVAFFFKQWGAWAPSTPEAAAGNPRSGWRCLAAHPHVPKQVELYPESFAAFVEHMSKARAGRLLDGVEHNAMPVRS